MSKRAILPLAAVVSAALLAACASSRWEPPAYESAMKNYYEAHASEKNGRCLAPYIDGFTRVQVVEETPERLVVDARYLYRDWVKDRDGRGNDGSIRECIGYGQRSFVLAQSDDRLQVMEMSGARRN
jgi:hypothetical protein